MRTTPTRSLALLLACVACGSESVTGTNSSFGGAGGAASLGGAESGGVAHSGGASGAIAAGGTIAGVGGSTAGGAMPNGGALLMNGGATAQGGSSGGSMNGGSTTRGGASFGGATGGGSANGGAGGKALSFKADVWPVFAKIRDPIFVYYDQSTYESCVTGGVCHGGTSPGAGLRMPNAEMAYAMLRDVPSRTRLCDGTTRVVAGDPDRSCLILFYQTRLRDELDWVDTAEIDLVRQWILQGALP